jgi:NADPH:quinone reductase-like Zn-dependent oxidoreductase
MNVYVRVEFYVTTKDFKMKKVLIEKSGGYEQLKIVSCEIPKPTEGTVLVQIHAFGVNYADCMVRMGLYESAKKYVGWPITPGNCSNRLEPVLGFEFSGTVISFGPDSPDQEVEKKFAAKNIKIGDKVFGVSRFGAYATHVVVPKHQIYSLPKSMTMEEGYFPEFLR